MKRPSTTLKITKTHVMLMSDYLRSGLAGIIVRHKGVERGVSGISHFKDGTNPWVAIAHDGEETFQLRECTVPRLTIEAIKQG